MGESGGAAGMEADSLDASTLRGYKEGVVNLLHPGETVLGALRRLGGLQASPWPPPATRNRVHCVRDRGGEVRQGW